MASVDQKYGSWRYRIRYKENGSFRELSKSGYRLKSEAQAAAAEVEKSLHKGVHVDEAKQTIGEYMDHFLKIRKEQVRPSTYTRLEYQNRLYIQPTFKFTQLGELTRRDLNEWVVTLSKKLKAATARSVVGTFRSAIRYAVEEDRILEFNPLDHLKLPKMEYDDKQIKFFTKDQLATLMNYMRDHQQQTYRLSRQYYVLFGLLAHTGLRLGEALALTWSDIKGNQLTVNKQVHFDYHNHCSFVPPKTDSSYRTIAIDQFTQDLIKMQHKNRLAVVARYKTYQQPQEEEFKDLIFYGKNGLPLRPSSVRDQMKVFCEAAGVPVLSPHAFRHTHAVIMLEAGVNMKVVSDRLGHATINMTADVYMHVTKTMEKDAIERFANYV